MIYKQTYNDTILYDTLTYWPLSSRLWCCPCSLSAPRGEMPWKHTRQPFQLPRTDKGDWTWDLGACNEALEGPPTELLTSTDFNSLSTVTKAERRNVLRISRWRGWHGVGCQPLPPSRVVPTAMAVGGLPFDPSLLLGFGEPWDQSKVGAFRFFLFWCGYSNKPPILMVYTTHLWWLGGWFIIAIPTITRVSWAGGRMPGTDAGPCGGPHVLRRSDQAEPGTWGSYQGASIGEVQGTHALVFYSGTLTVDQTI